VCLEVWNTPRHICKIGYLLKISASPALPAQNPLSFGFLRSSGRRSRSGWRPRAPTAAASASCARWARTPASGCGAAASAWRTSTRWRPSAPAPTASARARRRPPPSTPVRTSGGWRSWRSRRPSSWRWGDMNIYMMLKMHIVAQRINQ